MPNNAYGRQATAGAQSGMAMQGEERCMLMAARVNLTDDDKKVDLKRGEKYTAQQILA